MIDDHLMERLLAIVGQLIVEIKADELSSQGGRHLIANTRIVPGGRSYRQALYAKEQGYSTILLGRIGDDHYGKIILDSLNALGISTQFIEVSKNEYTGISFEVNSRDAAQSVFLDPGASTGRGDFQYAIQNYLTLCDVIIINQWLDQGLSAMVLDLATRTSIPTIYVCSTPPKDKPLAVDYLFMESGSNVDLMEAGSLQARKGLFYWSDGELSAFMPNGDQVYKLKLNRDWDGDYLAIRLMRSFSGSARLEETAEFAG
jgi:sugar/nucleoside kinase (ribokinase family)